MLLATLLIFLLSQAIAHPVSSLPPPDAVSSTPSPALDSFITTLCDCDPSSVRSKPRFIWNCLGTIFVCAYAAIHPNMPGRSASKGQKMWQKAKTCLYALFAPEVLISMAMCERYAAERIAREYRDRGWTRAHGFFVIMGGLVREDEKGCRVVTMSERGTVELDEVETKEVILPTISEEEIMDKSKGDFLAKIVVVIQTSWFLIQCIARPPQNLVLTGLELVTMAFSTLNVITYFLWWSKPLNAECPIYFKKDGSRSSGPMKIAKDSFGISERYSGIWFGLPWGHEQSESSSGIWQTTKGGMGPGATSYAKAVWKRLVKEPLLKIFDPMSDTMADHKVSTPESVGPYPSEKLSDTEWSSMALSSSLIGVVFGGVHLAGWNLQLPTDAELVLWRASSLVVTIKSTALSASLIAPRLLEKYPKVKSYIPSISIPPGLGFLLGPTLYAIARIILLFLPLYALRDVPESSFRTVNWSEYIPHI
ncbi:hypothetical protein AX16_003345 [Volvariella volvacea WC 439]|nr:hypothetical protein AX16_003345 [Volvariella volvacea WC 439]